MLLSQPACIKYIGSTVEYGPQPTCPEDCNSCPPAPLCYPPNGCIYGQPEYNQNGCLIGCGTLQCTSSSGGSTSSSSGTITTSSSSGGNPCTDGQWASMVRGFSSEGINIFEGAAQNALGPPDATTCMSESARTFWRPRYDSPSGEYLELYFPTELGMVFGPLRKKIVIREAFLQTPTGGGGAYASNFVKKVTIYPSELLPPLVVFDSTNGIDQSTCINQNLEISFEETPYPVSYVRIDTRGNNNPTGIDAVKVISHCAGLDSCRCPQNWRYYLGLCVPRLASDSCVPTYEPVCGCNGTTYDNQCLASLNGIKITSPGPCSGSTTSSSSGSTISSSGCSTIRGDCPLGATVPQCCPDRTYICNPAIGTPACAEYEVYPGQLFPGCRQADGVFRPLVGYCNISSSSSSSSGGVSTSSSSGGSQTSCIGQFCTADPVAGCGAGCYCKPSVGRCNTNPPGCETGCEESSQCGSGKYCGSTCCRDNPAGCEIGCQNSQTCPADKICQNNCCVPFNCAQTCKRASDCGEGKYCKRIDPYRGCCNPNPSGCQHGCEGATGEKDCDFLEDEDPGYQYGCMDNCCKVSSPLSSSIPGRCRPVCLEGASSPKCCLANPTVKCLNSNQTPLCHNGQPCCQLPSGLISCSNSNPYCE